MTDITNPQNQQARQDKNAIDLDGNYYLKGTNVNLKDNYTIAFWLNLSSENTYPAPLSSNEKGEWVINNAASGNKQIEWHSNDKSKAPIIVAKNLEIDNQWHHIALTVSKTTKTVYSALDIKNKEGVTTSARGIQEIKWYIETKELNKISELEEKLKKISFEKRSITIYQIKTYLDKHSLGISEIIEIDNQLSEEKWLYTKLGQVEKGDNTGRYTLVTMLGEYFDFKTYARTIAPGSLDFSGDMEIGYYQAGDTEHFLQGRLNHLAIYTSTLTDNQIQQLYNNFDPLEKDNLKDLFHLINPDREKQEALTRLERITHEVSSAQALFKKGLHSCIDIAKMSQADFVNQYKDAFGEDEKKATKAYQEAVARRSQLTLHHISLKDHGSAHTRAALFNNLSNKTDSKHQNLPDYQELFGNTDFCTSEECRSIFSPAAYLVDLMRFKDKYLTNLLNSDDKYQLEQRRPDLNEIVLSCENTNTLVPKLDIVNKVLEHHAEIINGDYQTLADAKYPFNLPFHWPLEQIRRYLAAFKTDLPTIGKIFAKAGDDLTNLCREQLNLSPEEYDLYTTSKASEVDLKAAYGLDDLAELFDSLENVSIFLKQTGLTITELQDLLHQDLDDDEFKTIAPKFFINKIGPNNGNPPIDIQGDKLNDLSEERLDRLHRFIRLAKKVGLTFSELDWVIRTVWTVENNDAADLDVVIPYLAKIKQLQERYGVFYL